MQLSSYKVNPKHRAKVATSNASIWSVSEWIEVHLFAEAGNNNWLSPGKNVLWALKPEGKTLLKIGEDPQNTLNFAKFVCDQNNEWHGYPVHPRNADIPPEEILEKWRNLNYIDKTVKRKIQSGKY